MKKIIFLLFSFNTVAETEKVVIKGKWQVKKAYPILLNLMKKYGGKIEYMGGKSCKGSTCKMEHKIIEHYFLKYESYEVMMVSGYSIPTQDGSCHACMVKISIAEFVKNKSGWNLRNTYINAFEGGSWGKLPDIRVLQIGYNILGIATESGYGSQGSYTHSTSIYMPVADEITEVFELDTAESYSEKDNWDDWTAKINIIKFGTSFYDLLVKKNGYENGKKVNSTVVYKFDGRKYSKSETYQ